MTHANTSPKSRSFLVLTGTVLTVAFLIGGAFYTRGPDLTFAPQMAEAPVILADGSALHVQKYEVTIAEWNKCHMAGGCSLALRATGSQTEAEMPATGLSFMDVAEYVTWINAKTRMQFRLPTLAEWELMAAEVLPPAPDPIFTDPELTWASTYLMEPQTKRTLRPKGAFETTSQGIVDLNGSVWEWTQDCYVGAAEGQLTPDRCPAFFVGGEHVAAMSYLVRDPARGGCAVGTPPAHLGMRLVSDQAS
ncbi:SUMF1/EgtB/PvdO family nonheme iron enzyme [Yoonia sp.]|uniref:formylglycine-generating enzyme family protein n=1 Tax=Yoonia sp. TaxID=2212373 RepID=UPI0025F8B1E9|nr:SUMF1/EgtB/PvdO family nonheme iron enzyme [Yoonia sp.]